MPQRLYRLTVVGCALSWFLVGLHFPVVHQITHHGQTPGLVLGFTSLFVITGAVGLWQLLRAR